MDIRAGVLLWVTSPGLGELPERSISVQVDNETGGCAALLQTLAQTANCEISAEMLNRCLFLTAVLETHILSVVSETSPHFILGHVILLWEN